jgi:tetratricopeptide (TPR) repeat protein
MLIIFNIDKSTRLRFMINKKFAVIVLATGLLLSIGCVVCQYKDEYAKEIGSKEQAPKEPKIEPVQNTIKGLPSVVLGEDNWLNQGAILRAEGKYTEALEAFENATSMNPPLDAHAWFDKGTVYWQLGKYDLAMQAFDESIKLNSSNALPWFYKGIIYSDEEKYGDALLSIDKAIELNPELDIARYIKGTILQGLGRDSEATSAFGKFAELLCDRFSTEHKLINPVSLASLVSPAENTNSSIVGVGSGDIRPFGGA